MRKTISKKTERVDKKNTLTKESNISKNSEKSTLAI